MILTKKVTTTWERPSSPDAPPEFRQEWETYIANAVQAGKTDGVRVEVSPECSIRYWVDEAAALEWKNFEEAFAAKWTVPVPDILIEDNV